MSNRDDLHYRLKRRNFIDASTKPKETHTSQLADTTAANFSSASTSQDSDKKTDVKSEPSRNQITVQSKHPFLRNFLHNLHVSRTQKILAGSVVITLIIVISLTIILKPFTSITKGVSSKLVSSKDDASTLSVSGNHASVASLFTFYQKLFDFPLYTPTSLPKGFSVDATSFKNKDSILDFYITATNGQKLPVTEQKKTPGFVIPKPSKSIDVGSLPTVNFDTSSGKGALLQAGANSIALLETDKTLIICNVNTISSHDAETIIRGFSALK